MGWAVVVTNNVVVLGGGGIHLIISLVGLRLHLHLILRGWHLIIVIALLRGIHLLLLILHPLMHGYQELGLLLLRCVVEVVAIVLLRCLRGRAGSTVVLRLGRVGTTVAQHVEQRLGRVVVADGAHGVLAQHGGVGLASIRWLVHLVVHHWEAILIHKHLVALLLLLLLLQLQLLLKLIQVHPLRNPPLALQHSGQQAHIDTTIIIVVIVVVVPILLNHVTVSRANAG